MTRTLWAIGILLGWVAAWGQVQNNPDGADAKPFLGLAHVAIRVKDLAASEAFYEKLGFEKAFSAEKNGAVTQAFLKINDRQFLEIYPQMPGGTGLNGEHEPTGFLHLCFDGKDLEALHTHYLNEGLQPIAVRKAGMGNLLFTMRGPEGQNIEYTQYLPGSKHSLDMGQHLGGSRISEEMFGVALSMRDLPAAMKFYKGELGFATLDRRPDILVIPGSAEEIYLYSSEAGDTLSRTYFAVGDVGKAAAELKRRGISRKKEKGA